MEPRLHIQEHGSTGRVLNCRTLLMLSISCHDLFLKRNPKPLLADFLAGAVWTGESRCTVTGPCRGLCGSCPQNNGKPFGGTLIPKIARRDQMPATHPSSKGCCRWPVPMSRAFETNASRDV